LEQIIIKLIPTTQLKCRLQVTLKYNKQNNKMFIKLPEQIQNPVTGPKNSLLSNLFMTRLL
jgi:hypothetical protein